MAQIFLPSYDYLFNCCFHCALPILFFDFVLFSFCCCRVHIQVQLQANIVTWVGMQTKTVVAVNMTFVRTHCRRASANAAYAINSNSRDRIVIVMHDFADACKD